VLDATFLFVENCLTADVGDASIGESIRARAAGAVGDKGRNYAVGGIRSLSAEVGSAGSSGIAAKTGHIAVSGISASGADLTKGVSASERSAGGSAVIGSIVAIALRVGTARLSEAGTSGERREFSGHSTASDAIEESLLIAVHGELFVAALVNADLSGVRDVLGRLWDWISEAESGQRGEEDEGCEGAHTEEKSQL
jgi:hypothetical protein